MSTFNDKARGRGLQAARFELEIAPGVVMTTTAQRRLFKVWTRSTTARNAFKFTCKKQGILASPLDDYEAPAQLNDTPAQRKLRIDGEAQFTWFECVGMPEALDYLASQEYVHEEEQALSSRAPSGYQKHWAAGAGPEKQRAKGPRGADETRVLMDDPRYTSNSPEMLARKDD